MSWKALNTNNGGIKNRDSCDILRDNSFLSTILNAYAHEIGYRYLTTTLSPTIKEILHYSKDLELDPHCIKKRLISEQTLNSQQMMRSAPVQETSSLSIQYEPLSGIPIDYGHNCFDIENEEDIDLRTRRIVNNNIAKIENICLTLLNTIINNKEKMPNTLHHLCHSIANVIEYSYNKEVQKNDVNITEMDYVSRQNSDLSMFNILNYGNGDECKTPDFSATPILTPFSTTPISANFLTPDDKYFDHSRSNSFSLDTQNIYNQSVYSSNINDKDKSVLQSNGSLTNNTGCSLSASPSRNSLKHKKYESYTAGITYNTGFNNLKSIATNLSNSSNINSCEYENESATGSNKFINHRYSYNNKSYKEAQNYSNNNSNNNSIEQLNGNKIELKSDDNNTINATTERRNSQDRDKYLKQQRRYNIFNNDFYSKSFKIQNQNLDIININSNKDNDSKVKDGEDNNYKDNYGSENNLLCSSPTFISLNIEDNENVNEDSTFSLNEIYKKTDLDDTCSSIYKHLNDRSSCTIEEEEEEDEEENEKEENESHSSDANNNYEIKNKVEKHHINKVFNSNDSLFFDFNISENNNSKYNTNEGTKIKATEIEKYDKKMEKENGTDDSSEDNNSTISDDNKNDKLDVYLDIQNIINDIDNNLKNEDSETKNNKLSDTHITKETKQIDETISGTNITIKSNTASTKEDKANQDNITKEIKIEKNKIYDCVVNEEERGQIMRFSMLQRELFPDFNKNNKNDPQEKKEVENDSRKNSVIKVSLQHESSSISDSLNGSKLELEKRELNDSNSDINFLKNTRRINSENCILSNINSEMSIDDVHMSKSYLHAKQTSQSSLLSRKNELGLKIETNNIMKPRSKNIIVKPLSDDIDPLNENQNKINKKEIASATIKGNPRIIEPKGPISSREFKEERYFVSLNDLECKSEYRKSKLEKQGSGFFLTKVIEYTNSEKVVGTFLFLRFFVPEKEPLSSKSKLFDIEFDTLLNKGKYGSEYSSENSSYISLTTQEPNAPSPGFSLDDRSKVKDEFLFSPKKKNTKNRMSISRFADDSCFSSLPILNIDTNSSMEHLTIKEKSPFGKESYTGSKSSIYSNNRHNLKIGSVRVKHVPLNGNDSTRSSIKNINTNEIKKDYDLEIKDIITFLTKNVNALEKEIESKTSIIPPEESEVKKKKKKRIITNLH
ncbi:hypothetical protein BCR36DRAFT_292634 [Piromyces finnis]|uniref:Ras-GAP domain-containing protein n=1 Tax=Piromyces finnis TaxID=1754191 RepID=A0A1Y1V780_9FUNG|nr:hypothetical protein BCR36DRAFT_292634 [Piromyces finnis]|eukprot:ORX48919.1 hypothetical protein BCR36DRAFT_292634 [Piromyces finnis]